MDDGSTLSRTSKRRKIARGDDDYLPGNIVQIEVHNFMTYSHLKVQPQPRLNLVIGANGTGKSSLVCAIGIGLAGEPQLLGRASSIGDFVKRGEESAWIALSLRGNNPGETIVITRQMSKNNKSDWQLNGKAATKKEVQDIVQKLNIQVNNLTQFLPQDRVSEFAKMSPIQLLEETEKAVGNPELFQQHTALIQKNDEMKKLLVSVKQNETMLSQYRANNADLEKDVERLEQRKKLLEKVDYLKKKLPWLIYDKTKQSYHAAKEKEKEAKDRCDNIAVQIAAKKAPISEKKKKKEQLEAANRKLTQKLSANERQRTVLADLESKSAEKVKSLIKEIENLHKREAVRLEKIEKALQDLASSEAELKNLQEYILPKDQLQELSSQIRDMDVAIREKSREKHDKESSIQLYQKKLEHCRSRLKEIESVKTRKLQALQNTGACQILDAYNWVQNNKHICKKEVFGPLLLEVEIHNTEHAQYLEGHVPTYMWQSFVTQDKEDRDFIVRNLKQYSIPVLNSCGEAARFHSPHVHISDELRALGVETTLDQVFAAPHVVKDVLIGQAGLHQSFVGCKETDKRADRACNLGVKDLWTPDNHYRWQESRYGKHLSASVRPVYPCRLFSQSVDASEWEKLKQIKEDIEKTLFELESDIAGVKIRLTRLEDEDAKLQKQREEIQKTANCKRKARMELISRTEQRRARLEALQNEEDSKQAECRLQWSISEINEQRCRSALELKGLYYEAAANCLIYSAQQLFAMELDIQIREMEKENHCQEQLAFHAQQEYSQCQSDTSTWKKNLYLTKDKAEKVAKLSPDLQRMFATMPTTIEDLEDSIQETTAEANAVICPNPSILEEYKRRCEQIDRLTTKLSSERELSNKCLEAIEVTKSQWLPTLRDLVSKINDTFGRNFREMAIAGEVTLDEHGDEFNQYGILIKVKFREAGELQVLSAHHQSGGERSVSTILFLVSLQDLSYCPFRVVDEINQGMDPYNERKMFQQLVRASSQANTPQCFLLTPKLLPDLEFSTACNVLTIMNGPWIGRASEKYSDGAPYSATIRL